MHSKIAPVVSQKWKIQDDKYSEENEYRSQDSRTQTGETTEDVAPTSQEELEHSLPGLGHRPLSGVPLSVPTHISALSRLCLE